MNDYSHPKWPQRHEPTITSHEIGTKVVCECGWYSTAPNPPRATAAYLEHLKTAEETR